MVEIDLKQNGAAVAVGRGDERKYRWSHMVVVIIMIWPMMTMVFYSRNMLEVR